MNKTNINSKDKRKMHSSTLYKSMMKAIRISNNSKIYKDIFDRSLLSFSNLTNIDESENNPDSISLSQEIFKVVSFKMQYIDNELKKYQDVISSRLESYKSYITSGEHKRDLSLLLDEARKDLLEQEKKLKQTEKALEQLKKTGKQPEKIMQKEELKSISKEAEILFPIFLKTRKIEALQNAEKLIITCRKLAKDKKYKKAMIYALHIASFIIAMQQSDLLAVAMKGKKFTRNPDKLRAEAQAKAIERKKELLGKGYSPNKANGIVQCEFEQIEEFKNLFFVRKKGKSPECWGVGNWNKFLRI